MEPSVEFQDKVQSLKKNSEGYQVLFRAHAAVYYLKQSNPNFKSLEGILKEFEKNDKNLTVNALSVSMEIQALTP
jgi:hypothetical protein